MKHADLFKEMMFIRHNTKGDAIYNVDSFLSELARNNKELAQSFMLDLMENGNEYLAANPKSAPISVVRVINRIKERLQ